MTTELKLYQDPVPHYRWDDITDSLDSDEVSRFNDWMAGQTCCESPGGGAGVYRWDYERWVRQGKKTEQGKDWD